MREIKFRGKTINTNEWVYGHYFTSENGTIHIIRSNDIDFHINPITLCQYTGVKTKNTSYVWDDSTEIYECDIINRNDDTTYKVIFEDCEFYGISNDGDYYGRYTINIHNTIRNHSTVLKIVGNIFDNPELYKK